MNRLKNGVDLRHPSSFRDPDSTVLLDGDSVLRVFRTSSSSDEAIRALDAPFAREAVGEGKLLAARQIAEADVPSGYKGGLRSRRLPFVTDPREWSFEMRKDAALLTLGLSRDALDDGFEMKDASAFNVLFDGCHPTFIDHGSFRESYSGHWPGYSQFGDHFMNPLVTEANAGVAGTTGFGIDGIPLGTAAAYSRGSGRLKKGAFAWIWRRALAERASGRTTVGTSEKLSRASLPRQAVEGMQAKTSALVGSLRSAAPSIWQDYEASACPYDDTQAATKRSLVDAWAAELDANKSALDVGCNIGTFTEILADHFEQVIAVDNDSVAIDRLYRRGSAEAWGKHVTPAVLDLAQPTPAIGWLNRERASFLDRLGVVELSVWLAVIHHLTLAGGIPHAHVLDLVRRISRHAIVEHIAPEDESVKTMTAGRRWASVPDVGEFRALLNGQGFTVLRSEETSPTRTLVLVRCPR